MSTNTLLFLLFVLLTLTTVTSVLTFVNTAAPRFERAMHEYIVKMEAAKKKEEESRAKKF
jgi:hypothetical protein